MLKASPGLKCNNTKKSSGMVLCIYMWEKNKNSYHLVPKVVTDLPFEGKKVEGSQKNRRWETVPQLGSRREGTISEPIMVILALESSTK